MRSYIRMMLCVAILVGITGAKGQKGNKPNRPGREPETTVSEMKLPEKVRATFVDKFPNAVINKAKSEKKNGVAVWGIDFRDGKSQRATDIAEDGTMLAVIANITVKTMPKPAMRKLEAAAKENDARLGRLERLDVSSETKDGKVVKLDKQQTRYAAEVTKGSQTMKIIVDARGKIVEEPKWDATKDAAKKSA